MKPSILQYLVGLSPQILAAPDNQMEQLFRHPDKERMFSTARSLLLSSVPKEF
jgi:hypothetical protein